MFRVRTVPRGHHVPPIGMTQGPFGGGSIMEDALPAGSARRRAPRIFGPGVFALSLTLVDQRQKHAVAANALNRTHRQRQTSGKRRCDPLLPGAGGASRQSGDGHRSPQARVRSCRSVVVLHHPRPEVHSCTYRQSPRLLRRRTHRRRVGPTDAPYANPSVTPWPRHSAAIGAGASFV
jgi:hypothetical protein